MPFFFLHHPPLFRFELSKIPSSLFCFSCLILRCFAFDVTAAKLSDQVSCSVSSVNATSVLIVVRLIQEYSNTTPSNQDWEAEAWSPEAKHRFGAGALICIYCGVRAEVGSHDEQLTPTLNG